MRPPTGVRWISSQPNTGYGQAAVGYLAALEALGLPLTWTPLAWRDGRPVVLDRYDGPMAHLAHRDIDFDTVVVDLPPGDHQRWLDGAGDRRRLLYTTWETDSPPGHWGDPWSNFDAVMVPTAFNRDALLAVAPGTAVHTVPHCARRLTEVEPASFERIGSRFVFYTIGTWSSRKAMAETVTAFLDAFGPDDDVALVVKTSAQDIVALRRIRREARPAPVGDAGAGHWQASTALALAKVLAGRRRLPEVVLVPQELSDRDLDAVHARGDCFVSLTRCEGWGLCIADALLFANPVVVTGWGGQLEYLGADYPLLVDYDLVPTTHDVPDDWFEPSERLRWARARHDHAVDLLRWVADHRGDAAAIGAAHGARITRQYAPEIVGQQLLSALSRP